jgi:cysteine desulfurase
MRAGTENVYGIAGMSRALELAYDDFSAKKAHVESIRDQLKTGLQQTFADVTFNGPQNGESLYTILNVGFPKTPKSDMLLYSLDIRGICASAGSACSSGATSSSHVIEALKLPEDRSYIRFSFSHLNTEKEVDYLLEKLKESL